MSRVTGKNLTFLSMQWYGGRKMKSFWPVEMDRTLWHDKSKVSGITITVEYRGHSTGAGFVCLQKENLIPWFAF